MNKVIMMGRIANDLELKTTPQGTPVCSFRIAVDRNFQKKGEERKADFFNVVAWRQTAEFITRWFAKGRMILIEGEMQTRQYTDKNGNPATWYEIQTDNVFFTGEKANGGGNGGYSGPPSYGDPPPERGSYSAPSGGGSASNDSAAQPQNTQAGDFSSASDDSYPF